MSAFVTGGAGFLLAVLWFDLMFDVQVLRHRADRVPDEALASISAYYGRVTTGASPMNRLVGVVMLATLAAIVVQIAQGDAPAWAGWASLALTGCAVVLAAAHTVPAAVRLGRQAGPPELRGTLARSILRDHLLCVAAVASVLTIQLAFAG